jgi:hypothetical protein
VKICHVEKGRFGRAGLAALAIRYYEEIGVLPKPVRAGVSSDFAGTLLPRSTGALLARTRTCKDPSECGRRLAAEWR